MIIQDRKGGDDSVVCNQGHFSVCFEFSAHFSGTLLLIQEVISQWCY